MRSVLDLFPRATHASAMLPEGPVRAPRSATVTDCRKTRDSDLTTAVFERKAKNSPPFCGFFDSAVRERLGPGGRLFAIWNRAPWCANRSFTVAARGGLFLCCQMAVLVAAGVASAAERAPWVSGRVVGSPEAPPPYQSEPAFPKLTFTHADDIAFLPDNSRVFVVEQGAKIYSFRNDPTCDKADLFTDLNKDVKGLDRVPGCKGVNSAFGITFHPRFAENHYCYLCYLLNPAKSMRNFENGSRVSRFTVTRESPPRIDPGSEVVLLEWLGGGHNGGCLKFGPDGFLYVSAGDSGDPNPPDPFKTGQDISDLMSSILRIDVDHPQGGKPYSIPPDNPFVGTAGARPEVWALGLRNPWRMSFDRKTGNLWAGDVGWELWEMVYHIRRGGNYGWSITEGPQPVYADGVKGPAPILKPDLALPHTEAASVTGGFVYRGTRFPELVGQYIFGDWETRRIWAAKVTGDHGDALEPYRQIAQTDQRIVAFAEDAAGELYFVDYEGGGVHRLAPNAASGKTAAFPRKLSETGLFASVAKHEPTAGVVQFDINAEQWNDGAKAERFIAIPGTGGPTRADGKTIYPANTVLGRTFSLASDRSPGPRVETQLLHFDGKRWNGYSYQWNDEQTDATLVEAAGAERSWSVPDPAAAGKTREKTWRYNSRAQCMTCHTSWSDYTLAYTLAQLDTRGEPGATPQATTLREMGILPLSADAGEKRLVGPFDATADLNDRAEAYLHVNCSHCHRFGGGGSALIDLRRETPPGKAHVLNAPVTLGGFGIPEARIVAPGDPGRSVLLYRMAKLGRGRMPHIGSAEVDRAGVRLIAEWIASLPLPADEGAPHDAIIDGRLADAASIRKLSSGEGGADACRWLLGSTSGSLRLVAALAQADFPETAVKQAIDLGATSPDEAVRDLFEPFLPPERLVKRLGPTINPASLLAMAGDAAAGRKIFFELGGGLCRQCHIVGGQGASFGPDLSHIGTKYTRAQIVENILEPSKTIDPTFAGYVLKTKGGDAY